MRQDKRKIARAVARSPALTVLIKGGTMFFLLASLLVFLSHVGA